MRIRLVVGAAVAGQILMSSSPVLAQDRLLTPSEKREFHACLYAAYIDDYCRFHAQGFSEQAFRECVISNRGGRISVEVRLFWGPGIEGYCRAQVQGGAR
jgi:hypothetical protein